MAQAGRSKYGFNNTDIEVSLQLNYAICGNRTGIFKSTNNGTNWTAINTGLDTSMGTSVYALFASGTNLFAGTEAGVFLSAGSYTNWTGVNTGLPKLIFMLCPERVLYICRSMGVYRTTIMVETGHR